MLSLKDILFIADNLLIIKKARNNNIDLTS